MGIYYIDPTESYSFALGKWILDNYGECLSKVRIILPSRLMCRNLQRDIVISSRKDGLLLPKIFTISDLKIIHNLEREVHHIEQRVLISEIVKKSRLNLNIDAISISKSLVSLLNEFVICGIKREEIKNLAAYHISEHWYNILQFLDFVITEYEEILQKLNKDDIARNYINSIKKEIDLIVHGSYITIVAGVLPQDLQQHKLCIAAAKNGHVILPPINLRSEKHSQILKCMEKFIREIQEEINFNDITAISKCTLTLCHRISEKMVGINEKWNIEGKNCKVNIQYIEVNDYFEEGQLVVILAQYMLQHGAKEVGIITSNARFVKVCIAFLQKFGLSYFNNLGECIDESSDVSLLLVLLEACSTFSIQKFISFIKHPNLLKEETLILEKEILRKQKDIDDWDKLLSLYKSSLLCNILECIWPLISLFKQSKCKFNIVLDTAIGCIERMHKEGLSRQIWCESRDIGSFIKDLIKHCTWEIETHKYIALFKELLEGKRYYRESKDNVEVVFMSPEQAIISNCEHIIIPDFNEGVWPTDIKHDVWLNEHLKEKLGILTQSDTIQLELYWLYVLLHKQHIYVTRTDGKVSSTPSRFLMPLLAILKQNNIKCSEIDWKFIMQSQYKAYTKLGQTYESFVTRFPSTISATNVEMLINNPYGFYAKKILHLNKLNDIEEQYNATDFGNFLHKVLKQYTVEKRCGVDYFLDIAVSNFPNTQVQTKWLPRIKGIARAFVDWHSVRMQDIKETFAEHYGNIEVELNSQKIINVTAIADYIEVTNSGEVCIIDYKTGIVPSKKYVMLGVAPQLIIEGIILSRGGFVGIPPRHPFTLVYIKLSSFSPFIKVQEMKLSTIELNLHYEAMKKTLTHFVETGDYFVKPSDELRYNDYIHLYQTSRSSLD